MKGNGKRWALVLLLASVLGVGCSRADVGAGEFQSERLSVVTTLFPYYDFIRQIAGDKVKLKLVVPAGMDSHSFEPTPADMIVIQNADIFIYNGGEMEQWVNEILDSIASPDLCAVSMMDSVDVLEEEIVEGMEEDSRDHDKELGQLPEIEYDEHIWTSPENAIKIVEAISRILMEKDPENREYYQEHTKNYGEQLRSLDEKFRQMLRERTVDMIVIGDKFPFRYLADAYDIQYRAAFAGCFGDTEPSARTIAYLIEQVRKHHLPVVYYLELSSQRVAQVIGEETGARPLLLHSCHNVTRQEFEEGITYIQLMEQNVEHLRQGLVY